MRRKTSSADKPLPVMQQRSQETVDRLLLAAEEALRDNGVDGATLREIAERAGVSVGIVYRRFPDKDAVLRAVYMRFFDRTRAANEAALASSGWNQLPAATIAEHLIVGMIAGHRANRKLLRALLLYAQTHDDRDFRARAEALRVASFEQIALYLEPYYADIDHKRPKEAVAFALAAVSTLVQQSMLFPDSVAGLVEEPRLATEATRLFLRYLGLGTEGASMSRAARKRMRR